MIDAAQVDIKVLAYAFTSARVTKPCSARESVVYLSRWWWMRTTICLVSRMDGPAPP